MSAKKMNKGLKIFLVVLVIIALLGVCFGALAFYAKHEFEKEKFWLPYVPQKQSMTELPENAVDAVAYVNRLYAEAVVSDEAEGSWRTDVDLGGELTVDLPEADAELIRYIRDGAAGKIAPLYPSASGVLMKDAQDAPEISLNAGDVLDYPVDRETVYNRDGTYKSDEYVIEFVVDPASVDAAALENGETAEGIKALLADALTAESVKVTPESVNMKFTIDRLTDHLLSVEIVNTYKIAASVRFTPAYAALSADAVNAEIPYKTTKHIDFKWYGARFLEGDITVRHDDIKTLPVVVSVDDEDVQGEDFTLEFTSTAPDILSVDQECVLHMHGRHDKDDPITVTMTLEYKGHTYTDEINVYVSDLDTVKTGVRMPQGEISVAVGESHLPIIEILVPEETKEDDYTLTFTSSDPDALRVDEDGTVTALKLTASPITVTLSMDCSGHTYTDELIVHITAETEGTTNG